MTAKDMECHYETHPSPIRLLWQHAELQTMLVDMNVVIRTSPAGSSCLPEFEFRLTFRLDIPGHRTMLHQNDVTMALEMLLDGRANYPFGQFSLAGNVLE